MYSINKIPVYVPTMTVYDGDLAITKTGGGIIVPDDSATPKKLTIIDDSGSPTVEINDA